MITKSNDEKLMQVGRIIWTVCEPIYSLANRSLNIQSIEASSQRIPQYTHLSPGIAMKMGPLLFRNQGLLIAEYDGFTNPRSVVLDKITVWA